MFFCSLYQQELFESQSDGKSPCVLAHESQKDVKIVDWRPNGGKSLSVACKLVLCDQSFLFLHRVQHFVCSLKFACSSGNTS